GHGIGELYIVGVRPRLVGVISIGDVDQIKVEIERGRGVDSVHIEIQIGGESDVVRRGSPRDGAVVVVEGSDLEAFPGGDGVEVGGGEIQPAFHVTGGGI